MVSPRLVLHPYDAQDLPLFLALALALALDARVTRLVGEGTEWSQDRARARWRTGLAAHHAGEGLWLKIVGRENGEHLGVVAAHTQGLDVEVGVWVLPERWSTGVAGEALRAVLPQLTRCFTQQQVVAEADVAHTASDRLLRSVGFRRGAQGVGRYGNTVYRYCWDSPGSEPDRSDVGA